MKKIGKIKFYFLQQTIDIIILIIFLFIFLRIQYQTFSQELINKINPQAFISLFQSHYKILFLFVLSWFLISNNLQLYSTHRNTKFVNLLKKFFFQIFLFSIVIFAISGLNKTDIFWGNVGFIYVGTLFSLGVLSRLAIFYYFKNLHRNGQNLSNVLVIDENNNTLNFINVLSERKDLGIKFFQQLKKEDLIFENRTLMINGLEFNRYLLENKIKKVFFSQKGELEPIMMNRIARLSEANMIPVSYIPDSIYNGLTDLKVTYIDTLPIFEVKRFPLDLSINLAIKRFIDLFLGVMISVFILSWLFPILALLIYFDSKGPIFFVQKRNGLNGNQFNCIKFRTMFVTNIHSTKITERNDPRVTKFGKFLRKNSLDELPQIINVLKGEMSFIGPRPQMPTEDYHYREIINRYNIRHYVKPGITGLSQVKGHRGAIDSIVDMEKRVRTDIYYVRNWSLLLDVQILYQTFMLVVKGDENAI